MANFRVQCLKDLDLGLTLRYILEMECLEDIRSRRDSGRRDDVVVEGEKGTM